MNTNLAHEFKEFIVCTSYDDFVVIACFKGLKYRRREIKIKPFSQVKGKLKIFDPTKTRIEFSSLIAQIQPVFQLPEQLIEI